jgi:hypothetical protein
MSNVFGPKEPGTVLATPACMSGRRSHARFAVLRSPEGVLRVRRDVLIQSAVHDQTIALSSEPGILGETVVVQSALQNDRGVKARVLESQPIVVDGSLRHQIRLHHIAAETEGDLDA